MDHVVRLIESNKVVLSLPPVLALLITLTSVATLAYPQAASNGLRAAKDRVSAPDFALTNANGNPISLSSYKGRVVLLDFWATWCTGCKVEIPWHMAFQEEYGLRGLSCIGVAMDEEGWEKVNPYLEIHPINYPVVLGNAGLIQAYQITNLPVTLLIDREGKIADAHVGMVVKDAWEKEIRLLLKEKQKRSTTHH